MSSYSASAVHIAAVAVHLAAAVHLVAVAVHTSRGSLVHTSRGCLDEKKDQDLHASLEDLHPDEKKAVQRSPKRWSLHEKESRLG